MVHRFDYRPTCRGKPNSAVRAVRVSEESVDDPCACRFSFGSSRHSKRTGKMKFVLDASAEGLQILLRRNTGSEIASTTKLDLFEDVLAWDWISADGEERRGEEGEERERLLYIRLHVGLRLLSLCRATKRAHGAKGRRAGTHGLRHQFICQTLLLLRSTLRQKKAGTTTNCRTPCGEIISASQDRGRSRAQRAELLQSPLFLGRGGSECAAAADVTPVLCVVAANAGEEMPAWSVWSLCLPSQAFFLPSDVRAGGPWIELCVPRPTTLFECRVRLTRRSLMTTSGYGREVNGWRRLPRSPLVVFCVALLSATLQIWFHGRLVDSISADTI